LPFGAELRAYFLPVLWKLPSLKKEKIKTVIVDKRVLIFVGLRSGTGTI